jgi:diadenosine tetraphosphate (Ap4A) HIT family hydrolase
MIQTLIGYIPSFISETITNNFLIRLFVSKGRFSKYDLVFPHEEIISRGIEIVEANPYIGSTKTDIREKNLGSSRGTVTTSFDHSLPIFAPENSTVCAIIDHYKQKYNVYIYFVTSQIENAIYRLTEQLENEKYIGIIANSPCHPGHVTPVIINKKDDNIFLLRFDAISDYTAIDSNLAEARNKLINKHGYQVTIINVGPEYQADYISCRIGAVSLLKDALRCPSLMDYFKNLKKYTSDDEKEFIKNDVSSAELPKFLFKIVQSKSLLDSLTTEDLQEPLKTAITNMKNPDKTLQTHLNKYNRDITVRIKKHIYTPSCITNRVVSWQVNTYLQTKAYRLAVKAFDILEGENGKKDEAMNEKLMRQYFNPHLINNKIIAFQEK